MEELKEFEFDYQITKEEMKKLNKQLSSKSYFVLFIPVIVAVIVLIINIGLYFKFRVIYMLFPAIIFVTFTLLFSSLSILLHRHKINKIEMPDVINYHIESYDKYFNINVKSEAGDTNDTIRYNEVYDYKKLKGFILIYRDPRLVYIVLNNANGEKITKKIDFLRSLNGRIN